MHSRNIKLQDLHPVTVQQGGQARVWAAKVPAWTGGHGV